MKDRKPLLARDLATTAAGITLFGVIYFTAHAGWNPMLGFFAACGAAGAVNWLFERL